MGCASVQDINNQNADIKQHQSQTIQNKFEINDKQMIQLITELQAATDSGDKSKQRSTIHEMQLKFMEYAESCANPIQIFGKLLDLVIDESGNPNYGLNSFFQKEIMHIAQLFMHQVYQKNKQGIIIAQETKQNWKDRIKSIRNIIQKSSVESVGLEYEIDCIESGMNVLGIGQLDVKDQVLTFANQIVIGIKEAAKMDFSSLIQAGKDIISQLGDMGSNKINEAWFLMVMTNYYTLYLLKQNPEHINFILQQLIDNMADWHVIYSGLDVIESHLEVNQVEIESIIQVLMKLSLLNQGINAWRVRNRVAELCIRNSIVKFPIEKLKNVYLQMMNNETNPKVQVTLQNADYIKTQKKALRECWEQNQSQEDDELDRLGKNLQQIQELIQNQTTEQLSSEEKERFEELLQYTKQRITLTTQMHQLIDVKSKKLEHLSDLTNKQEKFLQEIQSRLCKVETVVCGRTINELVSSIYDHYQQEKEEWKQRLSMYIPEKGVIDVKNIGDISLVIDVDEQIHNFLKDDNKKSMLIQGGAGTGKTIYCQYLITNLLKSREIIPIFITLPQLQNWEKQMVEETLQELKLSQIEIQKFQESKTQILFIIDGYDEIRSYKCLYNTNNLLNWNCKTIFTCRSSHLVGDPSYYKYFISSKFDKSTAFQEVILVHFDDQQINDYLERFVQKSQAKLAWDWKIYRTHVDTILGLRELVQNPFILSMIVTVLPKLVSKRTASKNLEKLISLDLYEEFVKQWFEKEEEKMITNNVATDVSDLQKEYEDYSLKLATKMIDVVKTVVEYTSTDKQSQWKAFFDPNNPRTTTIRRGAPLNTSSKFYSFIHKSIQEYFVAKNGQKQVQQLTVLLDDSSLKCSFNQHLVIDKGVFGFYSETIQRYSEFKKQLYQIIEMSKTSRTCFNCSRKRDHHSQRSKRISQRQRLQKRQNTWCKSQSCYARRFRLHWSGSFQRRFPICLACKCEIQWFKYEQR
ncbi:Pentapeptide_repeats-containing protein [Hexamita inflata]|uniref:Pentapeptide_repeats-containing protein n=1 Tax=Hexamita inflata TaxID=28002 RepID=A0ABP1HDR0_9EUKA